MSWANDADAVMVSPPAATGLSNSDFERFCEYFYKRTGIHFTSA